MQKYNYTNVFFSIDYITNSELDNVLEEIGPLDWEEVDELGETMQIQDMRDSIFADTTDPTMDFPTKIWL